MVTEQGDQAVTKQGKQSIKAGPVPRWRVRLAAFNGNTFKGDTGTAIDAASLDRMSSMFLSSLPLSNFTRRAAKYFVAGLVAVTLTACTGQSQIDQGQGPTGPYVPKLVRLNCSYA